jgi:uncharacterized protein YndB with AHSA1/START domain
MLLWFDPFGNCTATRAVVLARFGCVQIDNPDGTQARVRHRFAVAPTRLWRAFTDPADVARWMWGSYIKSCVAEVDLRVGGTYRVYTDSNATEHGWHTDRIGRLGIYVEIVPEERLVYTLHWDAPVGYNQSDGVVTDEVMAVTFVADGGGTLLDVLHLGIPDDGGSAVEHGRGLAEEVETLARLVETG